MVQCYWRRGSREGRSSAQSAPPVLQTAGPPACSGLSLLMQNIDYGAAAAGFPLGEREKAAGQQGFERTAQSGGQGATVAALRCAGAAACPSPTPPRYSVTYPGYT